MFWGGVTSPQFWWDKLTNNPVLNNRFVKGRVEI